MRYRIIIPGGGMLCALLAHQVGATPAPIAAPAPIATPVSATTAAHQDDSIPTALTVDQAVALGLERNPSTAAGIAAVASAKANYQSLKATPDINLAVSHIEGSSTALTLNGDTSDTFVDVGTTIYTSGTRRYQTRQAWEQTAVAQYQLDETKLTLAQQIRDAYWTLVTNHAQTTIAQQNLDDSQHVTDLTQIQNNAGAAPQTDVLASAINTANLEQSLITAQAAEHSAVIAFNSLLRRTPDSPIQLAAWQADEAPPAPYTVNPAQLPQLIQTALSTRPLVKGALSQVYAAGYAIDIAKAQRKPDLSLDYFQSVQESSNSSIVLAVKLPLLDFGNIKYSVISAQQSQRQITAQEQQAIQQVAQQVAQAYTDYGQAETMASGYRTKILEPSQVLLDKAQIGYKAGATNILAVLNAESNVRAARTGYINGLLSVYKAIDEIRAATGQ